MTLASMNATSHGAQSSPPGHRAVMGKAADRSASLLFPLLLHSLPTTPPPEKWVWPSRRVQRGANFPDSRIREEATFPGGQVKSTPEITKHCQRWPALGSWGPCTPPWCPGTPPGATPWQTAGRRTSGGSRWWEGEKKTAIEIVN